MHPPSPTKLYLRRLLVSINETIKCMALQYQKHIFQLYPNKYK